MMFETQNAAETGPMQDRSDLVFATGEEAEQAEHQDWSVKLRRLLHSDGQQKSSSGRNELIDLLCRPQMKGLLAAFNRLVALQTESAHSADCSTLPGVPHEVDDDDGLAIKVVRLVKSAAEPLGATIKEHNGRLLIARILRGGVADRCGCIGSGDQVIEVNSISVLGKKPTDVVRLLNNSNGSITFKLIPATQLPQPTTAISASSSQYKNQSDDGVPVHLRSMFAYRPADDFMNPCPEASLTLHAGDILYVLDSADNNWWQAKLTDCVDDSGGNQQQRQRVGLIPSPHRLQSFTGLKIPPQRQNADDAANSGSVNQSNGSSSQNNELCHQRTRRHHRIEMQSIFAASDASMISYEQVMLFSMPSGTYRPIVLIGPTGVGRTELKRRLLAEDSSKYRTTVPYTSRPAKPGEINGIHYHFTSRAQMEQWIRHGRLVEYGEYKSNLYGTTVDSIRQLIADGYVCILNPHPQAIRHLRKAELKPFFIYVRPAPLPILKATRIKDAGRGRMTVGQLEEMLEQGRCLEKSCAQYFDRILVNGNLDVAVCELLDIVSSTIHEPQWMPTSWVQ